jgi:arylsulfate sulfotransferase
VCSHRDHYVVLAQYGKTVDLSSLNPAWAAAAPVLAAVVQEIDHGRVIFEWESTDEPSLYVDSVEGNAFTTAEISDYVHINSIQVDPDDGNFIISLRHTNSILKLDRSTGATIWTLGGASDQFGLTAEQRFSHQHHARTLDNRRLLIFDNGNNAHPTRVVSFVLDEANKTVSSFEVIYERPAEQADTTFMGSAAQMAESRYLIGWGGRSDTTSTWPAVTETVAGVPVWSLTFAASNVFSYRALPVGTR